MAVWERIDGSVTLFVSASHKWELIGGPVTLFVNKEEVIPREWQQIDGTVTLFVSKGAPPEEGARFRGTITHIEPLVLLPGEQVNFLISFLAYADTFWEQINGWDTRLTISLDGMSDSDIQHHLGKEGHREGETLALGIMPEHSIAGVIILEARGSSPLPISQEWKQLDRVPITLAVPGEEEGKGLPLVLLLGGGAALALAAAMKKKS